LDLAQVDDEPSQVAQKLADISVTPKEDNVDQPTLAVKATKLLESEAQPVITVDADTPYQNAKVTQFDDLKLSKDILQGVAELNYVRPSQIQALAIPAIMANPPQHFIGQAQSGSGKTAAFGICMLSKVDRKVEAVQSICVAHTRELTRQIHDNISKLAKFTEPKIQVLLALPDTIQKLPSSTVKHHVVVSTPGTLLHLMEKGMVVPTSVKIFVLDEADELLRLQTGAENQAKKIIRRLNPQQICLFSATYNDTVKKFANSLVKFTVRIEIPPEKLSLEKLYQFYIRCATPSGEDIRLKVLESILQVVTVGQTIIFVHTIETGKRVQKLLQSKGFEISFLYGKGNDENQRDDTIDLFRKGKTRVLISTNVIARGLDVLGVSLVVNYDIPMDKDAKPDPETYLHRIGRSARWKNSGLAITFVHDKASFEKLKYIADHFQKEIKQRDPESVNGLDEELKSYGFQD